MRVLVIGATGTIGKGVSHAFAQAGHDVLCASRNGDVKVDVEDPASIRAMYKGIGKVGAVISCAGNGAFAPLSELTEEQIEYTLGSKLMGASEPGSFRNRSSRRWRGLRLDLGDIQPAPHAWSPRASDGKWSPREFRARGCARSTPEPSYRHYQPAIHY
jgi:hypothetical protein